MILKKSQPKNLFKTTLAPLVVHWLCRENLFSTKYQAKCWHRKKKLRLFIRLQYKTRLKAATSGKENCGKQNKSETQT